MRLAQLTGQVWTPVYLIASLLSNLRLHDEVLISFNGLNNEA
jgi:hypothetical protein